MLSKGLEESERVFEVKVYETESGNSPIRDFLRKLSKENKQNEITQIQTCVKLLEEYGMAVNNVRRHTIRSLDDGLYELRPGNNRVFFFYFIENKFVLLHAYPKSSQRAPQTELRKAKQEKDDYIRRNRK